MNTSRLFLGCFIVLGSSLTSVFGQSLFLSTQAEVNAWDQSITILTDSVTISGNDITNINALSNLTSIEAVSYTHLTLPTICSV